MATTLRLSSTLETRAKQHAADLGVSLNALVAVALDAYLRAGTSAPPTSHGRPEPGPVEQPTSPPAPGPLSGQDSQPGPRPAADRPSKPTKARKKSWR